MLILVLYLLLYFLPGFIFSRLTSGRLKNNPFFWLFLSSISVPFIYILLAYLKLLTLINYLLMLGFIFLIIFFLLKKFPSVNLNIEKVFEDIKEEKRSIFKILSFIVLGFFLLLLILPRIGLWEGKFPIGDDRHRMGKIVSIAESPSIPLFYRFPNTPLTIYYFDQVQSGLAVKFSNNQVKTNQAWVIHNLLRGLVIIWLIWLGVSRVIKDNFGRFVGILSLTFFGGLEFYLKLIKGVEINHIEWWTDWWGKEFFIHMQMSNPFTLAFWVPQHFLAGLLTIPLYLLLISKEKEKIIGRILIALILAAILGYSAFVFLTVVVTLVLYFLIRLLFKQEKCFSLIKWGFNIFLLSLILASPLIYLFATAEKQSYFFFSLQSFHFLNNNILFLKILNFLITVPYFLTVELGILFVVLLFYLYLFIKEKIWNSTLLFWYLMLLPLGLMFIFEAADDNNISMRSTIPAQITLALFAGLLATRLLNLLKKKLNLKFVYLLFALVIFFTVPNTFAEFYYRFTGQFTERYGVTDPIFVRIDQQVPLNSIIFARYYSEKSEIPTLHDSITALTHRFTFKPYSLFNVTDKEYSAASVTSKYQDNESFEALLESNSELKGYKKYFLDYVENVNSSGDRVNLKGVKIVDKSEKLVLYELE